MSTRRANAILSMLSGILVWACGAANTGHFETAGFQQSLYKYQVRYVDNPNSKSSLMSADWRIDNYYPSGSQQAMTPKTDAIYETEYGFDVDGDGKDDHTEKLLTYELLFTHLRTAGRIWVRAIPMAQYEGNLALDVLLQNYLDSVAGAGFEVAMLGKVTRVLEKRYAPRLISAVPASLAGREALAAIIDIANVDEVLVAPDARRQRIKIVIVRPGFTHLVQPNKLFPVMLVAGYSNQPDYFAQNQLDFDGLLQRFEIAGHSGYIEGPNRQLLPMPATKLETEPANPNANIPRPSTTPGITE